jgi:metal-responsive CopG/Arc/MetJ family transcriptional regulator
MLGKRGVDWMKRRSKTKFTQIHVSIPVRLLEDFDELLSFKASRSKAISHLMRKHIDGAYDDTPMMTSRQLMAMLTNRNDVDDLLKTLLLQILSQSS